MKSYLILAINPGSTSTKIALFQNTKQLFSEVLRHSKTELEAFNTIPDQYLMRKNQIIKFLADRGINLNCVSAIAARGGLMKPLKGGTYRISEEMVNDLKSMKYGCHASNLAAIIALELSKPLNIPCYITNPVVVDEFEDIARISGHPEIERKSAFHALNQKAMAKKAALEFKKSYEALNIIVAHLGGGISVGAHKKGKVIDVNNGLSEGPFSPERTGSLPVTDLVDLCFSGKYTKKEINKMLVGMGGLAAYLGTSDCVEVEKAISEGNIFTKTVYEAMAYQISKEIGACSTVLEGIVDCIVITGGIARSSLLVDNIVKRVKFIAPILVYPGEDEMKALTEGTFEVLTGETKELNY
jgi:butyrate kinase